MSDYTPITDFSVKDGLSSGNPAKLIVGADFDAEFDAINTAIASKYDVGDLANQTQAELEASNATLLTPLRLANWADYNAGIVGDLQALVDPNADGILFWDDSAGAAAFLTAGTGLTLSATTLTVDFTPLTGAAAVVPATGDSLLITDVSAAGASKTALVSDLITLTNAGAQSAVLHDSLSDYVANKHIDHTAVSISAGLGMTGGGTIAATRTLTLDFPGQSAIDVASVAADDVALIWDVSASAYKKIAIQDMGTRIQAAATQTLALDDANSVIVNTGASNYTITAPQNSDVAFPIGTEIGLICESTGLLTVAAGTGATVKSLNSYLAVKASGGAAYLVKTGTNTWTLAGNLQA